jgi:aminoglycoside phosphotransferase (APT) family kinase protein
MIETLNAHSFFATKTIESCVRLENQGYCNENFLVVVDRVKYIVRKLLRDDIDRALEWRVQNLAFRQGITVEPLVFDEENGFMVFAFLEGKHKNTLSKNELEFLAKTLRKLHSISIDAKPIELSIENKTDEVLRAFETIDTYPKEYVLCHNDPNPQNIFFADDVKFIDWEYAGVNDRYFDLASICVEFELVDEKREVFLNVYFEDEKFYIEKLEAYKIIYRVLCEEWFINNP